MTLHKKWRYVAVGTVLVVVGMWYALSRQAPSPAYESVTVSRNDITNVISVTGHAEPMKRLSLAFPVNGTLEAIYPEEGSEVMAGAPIAVLEDTIVQARAQELSARLVREEALTDDIIDGASPEERALRDVAVEKAQVSLTRAQVELRASLNHAYVVLDDAIREKADEVFEDAQGENPKFGIRFESGSTEYLIRADSETTSRLSAARGSLKQTLIDMAKIAQSTTILPEEAHDAILGYAREGEAFLNLLATTINRYVPTDTQAQAVYEGFQTSIATARTQVSNVIAELEAARTSLDVAQASLRVAEADQTLVEASVHTSTIQAQAALVAASRAALNTVQEEAGQYVLTSPIRGVVTELHLQEGETAGAGVPVVEILSEGTFELEVFIPEADIARVKLGDQAEVTFDAFERGDVFMAEVIRISLSETVREGVPTYKTTLVITKSPDGTRTLRAGMTADIDITTDERTNVLTVPTRSVITDGARTYVRVIRAEGDPEERSVVTGLRGSDGDIEILEGLSEGEVIVLYTPE